MNCTGVPSINFVFVLGIKVKTLHVSLLMYSHPLLSDQEGTSVTHPSDPFPCPRKKRVPEDPVPKV